MRSSRKKNVFTIQQKEGTENAYNQNIKLKMGIVLGPNNVSKRIIPCVFQLIGLKEAVLKLYYFKSQKEQRKNAIKDIKKNNRAKNDRKQF